MLIGELSRRTGLSRDTLRYYEKLGLLSPVNRHAGKGYKTYAPETVLRLRQVRSLLRDVQQGCDGACATVDGAPACMPQTTATSRSA